MEGRFVATWVLEFCVYPERRHHCNIGIQASSQKGARGCIERSLTLHILRLIIPYGHRRWRSSESSDSGTDSGAEDGLSSSKKERQIAHGVAALDLKEKNSGAVVSAKLTNASAGEKPKARVDASMREEFSKLFNTRSEESISRLRASLPFKPLLPPTRQTQNTNDCRGTPCIIPELFGENLVRGRRVVCTGRDEGAGGEFGIYAVFAAVVAVVNTKLPQVGELVLVRLVSQFRRSFKRNDKIVCNSSTTFIAHLVNQSVAHELLALQLLVLLLERPTDDSIEIAVSFTRQVGAFLAENSPKASATVFERFRAVLNEGKIHI